jgi:hypothetical protein
MAWGWIVPGLGRAAVCKWMGVRFSSPVSEDYAAKEK